MNILLIIFTWTSLTFFLKPGRLEQRLASLHLNTIHIGEQCVEIVSEQTRLLVRCAIKSVEVALNTERAEKGELQ